ncbi:hypothetical protein E2C01_063349 [Portunus trituberculatus]|uniref:Uncharacterized protein n=1 Tax=Portunus trituberculatus TaxID=210409 RepID=A0A5B7HKL2_PORTR|nr:hypothetical protein [Portunus trituberculatus]
MPRCFWGKEEEEEEEEEEEVMVEVEEEKPIRGNRLIATPSYKLPPSSSLLPSFPPFPSLIPCLHFTLSFIILVQRASTANTGLNKRPHTISHEDDTLEGASRP